MVMAIVMVIAMVIAMAMAMAMAMLMGNSDGPPYFVRNFYAVEAPFQSIYEWTAYLRMDCIFTNGPVHL